MTMVNSFQKPDSMSRPRPCSTSSMCPVLLMGRNSVMPSTMPIRMASQKSCIGFAQPASRLAPSLKHNSRSNEQRRITALDHLADDASERGPPFACRLHQRLGLLAWHADQQAAGGLRIVEKLHPHRFRFPLDAQVIGDICGI